MKYFCTREHFFSSLTTIMDVIEIYSDSLQWTKRRKKGGGNDFERDEIIEKNINNDVSNDPSPKSVTRSTFDLKRSKRLNDSSIVYYYIILLLCHRYISSCWRHREWLLKTHHNSWFSFGPFGAYRTTQHSNEVIIIIGGRLERWSL